MLKTKKIEIVKKLSEKVKNSPHLVIVNFGNLSHQKLEELRKKLYERSSSLQVVKNTLLEKALKIAKKGELIKKELLTGPSALLSLSDDWLKGLSAFFQVAKNEQGVSFKIGLIEQRVYQKNDLEKLAQLPPKEQLLGKVISTIKSPGTRMIFSMRFGMIKLINVLKNKVKS